MPQKFLELEESNIPVVEYVLPEQEFVELEEDNILETNAFMSFGFW